MQMHYVREFRISAANVLRTTPVFDTYWRFAAERQEIFFRRVLGVVAPWTADPILARYRFTNVYRVSDRVSQYLIRNVIYGDDQSEEEVFFRILLFKLFNRIETWELLESKLGPISWKTFRLDRYVALLDAEFESGRTLYSPAYIMPCPPFGSVRKHANHLQLLCVMMRDHAPLKISRSTTLKDVYTILRSYPSIGDFLAFQFSIDLNYSGIIDFSEMDFVVAGPGARSGISKAFYHTAGLDEEDIIRGVTDFADREFETRGLSFRRLWGRPLQLIDCQNLFCEVDKYSRAAHPEFSGKGRARIKQKFVAAQSALPQWYPPKWGLAVPEQFD
jgi:hypothetical protein